MFIDFKNSSIYRFGKDRAGNFAVMTALILPVLLGGVAFAINTGQLMNVKSNLSSALDFALASTARDISRGKLLPSEAEAYALRFLQANGPGGAFNGENIRFSSFELDETQKILRAQATVDTKFAFPMLASATDREISSTAAMSYGGDSVEIALVVDTTASMTRSRMRLLKAASHTFVDTLLTGSGKTRITLIPYSEGVRLDDTLAKYIFDEKTYTRPEENPPPYDGRGVETRCAMERKGDLMYSDVGPLEAMINNSYRTKDHRCPSTPMIPLTADADILNAAIDTFDNDWDTSGHIGLLWAWYMMSPKWGDFVPSTAVAKPYGSDTSKYVIYMTDGDLTASGMPYKEYRRDPPAVEWAKEMQATLCQQFKDNGVVIFVVGLAITKSSALEQLQSCASDSTPSTQFFYDVRNEDDLVEVFTDITASIGSLSFIE